MGKAGSVASQVVDVGSLIVTVRGQRVILDADLARIYGVPTFRFNDAVKRNSHRFPEDFRFQLTKEEWVTVQSVRLQAPVSDGDEVLTSQLAMSKKGRGGRRTRPSVFTEHGALMAANVLNSERAVEMSIYVIRAVGYTPEEFTAPEFASLLGIVRSGPTVWLGVGGWPRRARLGVCPGRDHE